VHGDVPLASLLLYVCAQLPQECLTFWARLLQARCFKLGDPAEDRHRHVIRKEGTMTAAAVRASNCKHNMR